MQVFFLPKIIMSLLLPSPSLLGIYTTRSQAASLMTELVTNGGAETEQIQTTKQLKPWEMGFFAVLAIPSLYYLLLR